MRRRLQNTSARNGQDRQQRSFDYKTRSGKDQREHLKGAGSWKLWPNGIWGYGIGGIVDDAWFSPCGHIRQDRSVQKSVSTGNGHGQGLRQFQLMEQLPQPGGLQQH